MDMPPRRSARVLEVEKKAEEIVSKKNLQVLDETVDSDFSLQTGVSAGRGKGEEFFRQFVQRACAQWSDPALEVQEVIRQGERLIIHWRVRGAFRGKQMDLSGVTSARVSEGKLTEMSNFIDEGMMHQLGFDPATGGAPR